MGFITMRQAISDALMEEMERDENVFIMGQEVGVWGGTYAVTRGFYDKFGPTRVRDTPISEMVIGGAATGAAMNGLRPVAEFMTINFAFWHWTPSLIMQQKFTICLVVKSKPRSSFAPQAAVGDSLARHIATRRMLSLPTFRD